MMDELDEIKRRKLEAFQRQYQDQAKSQMDEDAAVQQQIANLEAMVKPKLSKEALQRYGNIRAAHPEKAIQLLVVLARLMQMGKMNSVNDEELKKILLKISESEKKDTRIIRK